jgi:hypothetical protein
MKLVSGRARATEMNGGAVEERLNALQRRETPSLLTHHAPQELTYQLVDGSPPLGRYCPGFAQEIFFNDQGHIQPFRRHILCILPPGPAWHGFRAGLSLGRWPSVRGAAFESPGTLVGPWRDYTEESVPAELPCWRSASLGPPASLPATYSAYSLRPKGSRELSSGSPDSPPPSAHPLPGQVCQRRICRISRN